MSVNGVNGASYDLLARHMEEEDARSYEENSRTPATADAEHPISALLLEGDIGAQVAALAILSAKNQRETNGLLKVAEDAALDRAEAAQVAALHEKADDIRMTGLVEGGFGIASGACTFAGGWEGAESGERLEWKGAATAFEGGGKLLGGLPKAAQADDEANAATHEHEAAHQRRNLDATRDAIREGQDLLERALDFYKQNQQGAAEAMNTSARRG